MDDGSSYNDIDSLSLSYNKQDGFSFSGVGVLGNTFTHSGVRGNVRDGIRFEQGASGNAVGAVPDLTPFFFPNDINISGGDGEAAILITDASTGSNVVQNCSIFGESLGVLAENNADIGQITQSYLSQCTNGVILRDGAHDGALGGLTIQDSIDTGVLVMDAYNVLIGSQDPANYNQLSGNLSGIEISGAAATNNVVENNTIYGSFATPGNNAIYIHNGATHNSILDDNQLTYYQCGLRIEAASSNLVSEASIQNNYGPGVVIDSAATGNVIAGSVIQANVVGVLVSDEGSVGNTITGNSISYNTGEGIQLSAGGNNQIPPPTLPPYSGLTVYGSSSAPDGSVVEIFWDPGDQGQTFVGGGEVLSGHFSVVLDVDPKTLAPPI